MCVCVCVKVCVCVCVCVCGCVCTTEKDKESDNERERERARESEREREKKTEEQEIEDNAQEGDKNSLSMNAAHIGWPARSVCRLMVRAPRTRRSSRQWGHWMQTTGAKYATTGGALQTRSPRRQRPRTGAAPHHTRAREWACRSDACRQANRIHRLQGQELLLCCTIASLSTRHHRRPLATHWSLYLRHATHEGAVSIKCTAEGSA